MKAPVVPEPMAAQIEEPQPKLVQTTPAVDRSPSATPGLSPQARLQLAIKDLQDGMSKQAGAELKAYLAAVPDSKSGRYLLSQIETPLAKLFPAENFTVQLGKDETLSALAGTYLGDVLGFYALARYNAIAVPGKVLQGQTIRIPKTAEALAAQKARATTNAQVALAPASLGPNPQSAASAKPAAKLPAIRDTESEPVPSRPQATADVWRAIQEDIGAQQYGAAIETAESAHFKADKAQAPMLASAYLASAKLVRASDPALSKNQAVEAGQLYLETADRPEDAMAALEFATELSPNDKPAQTMLASAKEKTAESYYRTGLVAFRRQDLDAALTAWDHALAIDPNHKNAQVNKAQAVELKKALEKLR